MGAGHLSLTFDTEKPIIHARETQEWGERVELL